MRHASTPSSLASRHEARRHSTTRLLYILSAVSSLCDSTRQLVTTKVTPAGSCTRVPFNGLKSMRIAKPFSPIMEIAVGVGALRNVVNATDPKTVRH